MTNDYIKDLPRLITTIHKFAEFVKYRDETKSDYIDFSSQNSFLGKEEGYKTTVFNKANEVLEYGKWKRAMIGTGTILEQTRKAINKSGNLIYVNTKIDFLNKLNPESKDYINGSEQVIYDIYKSTGIEEEKVAFENAQEAFGGTYNRLAYLFFVKSCSTYMPISTKHLDKAFECLNIDFKTSSKCSWDNYYTYNQIISSIRAVLERELLTNEVRLLDAHSFLWIIAHDSFQNWIPNNEILNKIEENTEQALSESYTNEKSEKTSRLTFAYRRSAKVVQIVRNKAKGVCQLCNRNAPFTDKNGEPYLEVHHVQWLSKGGKDSTDNAVALCPNCHTKMHIVDDKNDFEKLIKIAKSNN